MTTNQGEVDAIAISERLPTKEEREGNVILWWHEFTERRTGDGANRRLLESRLRGIQMKLIGIDPGLSGGIAVCDLHGHVQAHTIPETETDLYSLFATLGPPSKAIIEKVHAFPGQGVSSMFSFGQIYGFKRACLISLGIPFDEVPPKTWQKELGLSFPKGTPYAERKKLAKMKAQQMYPGLVFDKACADALLILEFLRRREVGT